MHHLLHVTQHATDRMERRLAAARAYRGRPAGARGGPLRGSTAVLHHPPVSR